MTTSENVRALSSVWRKTSRWILLLGLAAGAAALVPQAAPGAAHSTGPAGDLRLTASSSKAVSLTPSFRVATFNMLGATHTGPGGDKGHRFPSYKKRTHHAVKIVDDHDFSLVGFQEMQTPQFKLFRSLTKGNWAFDPGLRLGKVPVQNSIGWRRDVWQLVERDTFTIPYFHGKTRPEPVVKLRQRSTGQTIWVMNTHNPSDNFGKAQKYRNQAIAIEAQLATQLSSDGTPVVFTGDFNDREKAFCSLVPAAPLKSASGGAVVDGNCEPPARMPVDWVFMSSFLTTSGYTILDTPLVHRTTDHFVVYADIAMPTGGPTT